jgi:hypothetical protein
MHLDLGFCDGTDIIFQLGVDDHSRKSHLDILDKKSETLEKWIELKQRLEKKHFPHKFAIVHTDGEIVYDNKAWEDHCRDHGLEHEFSSRYRHDQNGVVERRMQTIGTSFRCMMIQGSAPVTDAKDALYHANMLSNMAPTTANGGLSPNEKEAGVRLTVRKRVLKGPLFCLVYAHIYEEERSQGGQDKKSAHRAVPAVYLGYDDSNNAYKVKEWTSGDVYFTADVTFHPNTFPYRADPSRSRKFMGV